MGLSSAGKYNHGPLLSWNPHLFRGLPISSKRVAIPMKGSDPHLPTLLTLTCKPRQDLLDRSPFLFHLTSPPPPLLFFHLALLSSLTSLLNRSYHAPSSTQTPPFLPWGLTRFPTPPSQYPFPVPVNAGLNRFGPVRTFAVPSKFFPFPVLQSPLSAIARVFFRTVPRLSYFIWYPLSH